MLPNLMPVLGSISLMFAIMFVGYLYKRVFARYKWYPVSSRTLYNIVYWVLTPLTFIESFSKTGITGMLALPFASITAYALVAAVIIWRMDFGDEKAKYVVLLNSINQNNLFVGYPILYSAFGDATMALYFGLLSFAYTILAPEIITGGATLSLRLLTNPVVIGFALGNLIHYATPSIAATISNMLCWTPKTISYLSIFVMGMLLDLSRGWLSNKLKRAFYTTALIKFVLNPLAYLPFILLFHLPPLYAYETIVLGVMPPAVLNTVMAAKYGWHPEFTASSIFILTIASLILATILIAVITSI